MPLLAVRHLTSSFATQRGEVRAVDDVSFTLDAGETLCLVGESGCGKSTVGKAILRLFDITAGQVVLDGAPVAPEGPRRRDAGIKKMIV